jgi:PIN domain nuclease of toxin-antitoxin system
MPPYQNSRNTVNRDDSETMRSISLITYEIESIEQEIEKLQQSEWYQDYFREQTRNNNLREKFIVRRTSENPIR